MNTTLVLGYLRRDVESDRSRWLERSHNLHLLYTANQHVLNRQIAKAKQIFSQVIEPESPNERMLYWCSVSRYHALAAEHDQEERAMSLASRIEKTSHSVRACFELRQSAYTRSRKLNHESLLHAQRALSFAARDKQQIVMGFAQSEIGLSLLRLGDVSGAAVRLHKAYDSLKSELSAQQLATLAISLGSTYSRLSDFKRSIEVLSDLSALGSDVIGVRNYIAAQMATAIAYHQSSVYDEAIPRYQELMGTFRCQMDADLILQVTASLGDAYCEAGEFDKARQLLATDKGFIDSSTSSSRQAIWGTFGKIHAKLGNMETAKKFYQDALALVRDNDLTLRHRLFLEDYIASGCITNTDDALAVQKELTQVVARQLHEQSTTIAEIAGVNARQITTAIKLSDERKSEELRLMRDAQESVSTTIGSYLHSTTLQELLLLRLRIETMQHQLANHDLDGMLEQNLQWLMRQTNNVAEQVRDVSHHLHQHSITGANVPSSLAAYSAYMDRSTTSVSIACSSKGEFAPIDDTLAQDIYRCVQICTLNAIRHADCTTITINLTCNNGRISVCIVDNGRGFDTSNVAHGIGLRELHYLCQRASAELSINSTPKTGTTITVSIPVNQGKHTAD